MIPIQVDIDQIEDPAVALEQSMDLLSSDRWGYNLIASVVDESARRGTMIGNWLVRENGASAGIAIQTPGRDLNIGPMSRDAIRALVEHVSRALPDLGGVYGPAKEAAVFAADWNLAMQCGIWATGAERLMAYYPSADVTAPDGIAIGKAEANDRDSVAQLLSRFYEETGSNPAAAAEVVDQRLPEGRYYLLAIEKQIVALLALSQSVFETVRLQTVYVVPEYRERGIATYGVAVLAKSLAEVGLSCVLLTDLANPASNRAFVRAGFRPQSENLRFGFGQHRRLSAQ
jgi:predicted GNAT family acetyltransferase